MRTIALLTISNIFMTFAWYGHLKYRDVPLFKVIVISWMIAFFEYCFQVPANRIGSYEFTAAQLKTIQEVITLTVFAAILGPISEAAAALELPGRFRPDRRRRRRDLQEMVSPVHVQRRTPARLSDPRSRSRTIPSDRASPAARRLKFKGACLLPLRLLQNRDLPRVIQLMLRDPMQHVIKIVPFSRHTLPQPRVR